MPDRARHRPAIQRSTVVFPLPDAPNRPVTPLPGTLSSKSRAKSPRRVRKLASSPVTIVDFQSVCSKRTTLEGQKKKTPTASELLKKKQAKKVSPTYKPAKASGKTRAERDKIRGEGERYLKGVFKKQETDKYVKTTGQQPDKRGKMKIAGRVNKRMST